jgi:hypothetical protein
MDGESENPNARDEQPVGGTVSAPAGWYADPENAANVRYWDGSQWTDDFAPAQPTGALATGPAPVAPMYPSYASVPVQKTGTNGFSIASLVLGIIWLYWIGSILALIFGYVAKNQIDRTGGTQGGRGMAIAGIVLGWIGVGVLLLVIVLIVIGASTAPY